MSARSGRWAAVASGALAGAGARLAYAALRARPPGGNDRWDRTNHRGETITLLEGPAYVAGAAAAVALVPGLPTAARAAGLVALGGAGAFGAIDDLRESGTSKGLRGHLTELARGHVTTGGLKVLGIGVTGLISAVLAGDPDQPADQPSDQPSGRSRRLLEALLSGAVIAGSANLVNLLDLRPGRAFKAVLLTAVPLVAGPGRTVVLSSAAAGAAAALLPVDLSEQAMLGDTGANAAGALLGLAAVQRLGTTGQVTLLGVLGGLTLASEKISFTAVIESTPGLREFDGLGRRPRA